MKKFLTLFVVAVMAAVATSSCSDDYWDSDYYYSPLIGSWELYSVNGMPVSEWDVSEFTFIGDGTGIYGQFPSYGSMWNEYMISWYCDFPDNMTNLLYINTWDGQVWSYRFTVSYGRLTLRDLYTGDILVYLPY